MLNVNRMKLLLSTLSLLFLSACVPQPPDVFVFTLLSQRFSTDPVTGHTLYTPSPTCMAQINEPQCLYGVAIMSGTSIFVGENTLYKGKKASELQAEAIIVPAVESFAPLETYIINSCKKMNCNNSVDAFKIKLDGLNGVSGALNNP